MVDDVIEAPQEKRDMTWRERRQYEQERERQNFRDQIESGSLRIRQATADEMAQFAADKAARLAELAEYVDDPAERAEREKTASKAARRPQSRTATMVRVRQATPAEREQFRQDRERFLSGPPQPSKVSPAPKAAETLCAHCGEPFRPQTPRSRHCGKRCSQRASDEKRRERRRRPIPTPRVCALDGCDVGFQPKTATQVYCTHAHAHRAWHVKRRLGQRAA